MNDLATLTAERDVADLRAASVKSSLELAQTLSEQQQANIHALRGTLGEALRFMVGFEGDEAQRIDPLLARMRSCLGKVVATQGEASHATTDAPFQAWATGDDETFGPDGSPNVELASTALQVWSLCQQRARVTVAQAAQAFNVSEAMIREAVDGHHWMMVVADGGDELIYHEGE